VGGEHNAEAIGIEDRDSDPIPVWIGAGDHGTTRLDHKPVNLIPVAYVEHQ
jgi:hypothetical protein